MIYLWKFIHNALIHGLLMPWPWEPEWVQRLHDRTQAQWTKAWAKSRESKES